MCRPGPAPIHCHDDRPARTPVASERERGDKHTDDENDVEHAKGDVARATDVEHRCSDEQSRQRSQPRSRRLELRPPHAPEYGRSGGGAKVSTQSCRRETLHHERRRQDGQVILRSNFPRGSQPPTGNW